MIKDNICMACGSNNTHIFSMESVSFDYEEVTKLALGGVQTVNGTDTIRISKSLCLDCGNVFEKSNQDDLIKYKKRGK